MFRKDVFSFVVVIEYLKLLFGKVFSGLTLVTFFIELQASEIVYFFGLRVSGFGGFNYCACYQAIIISRFFFLDFVKSRERTYFSV